MSTILFLGDSLTAGYGLSNATTESFPSLIQQKIDAENLGFKVINAGLSGDTSEGGLNRLDYWIGQPVDLLVLELGINDIMRGISPQTTKQNLQKIIDKVKGRHPAVKTALMGMRIPSFISSPVASQFNDIYPELANNNQLSLVPFFLNGVIRKPHLNLPDGIHPSAAGYKVIADNVWPVIKKLIV